VPHHKLKGKSHRKRDIDKMGKALVNGYKIPVEVLRRYDRMVLLLSEQVKVN